METKSLYNSCYINGYNMVKSLNRDNILRYPRLDTVLMVEEFIQKHSTEFKKRKLWENLPKKMMYQTYCVVIDYLLSSGKILIDKEGYLIWTYDPEAIKDIISKGLIVR